MAQCVRTGCEQEAKWVADRSDPREGDSPLPLCQVHYESFLVDRRVDAGRRI